MPPVLESDNTGNSMGKQPRWRGGGTYAIAFYNVSAYIELAPLWKDFRYVSGMARARFVFVRRSLKARRRCLGKNAKRRHLPIEKGTKYSGFAIKHEPSSFRNLDGSKMSGFFQSLGSLWRPQKLGMMTAPFGMM